LFGRGCCGDRGNEAGGTRVERCERPDDAHQVNHNNCPPLQKLWSMLDKQHTPKLATEKAGLEDLVPGTAVTARYGACHCLIWVHKSSWCLTARLRLPSQRAKQKASESCRWLKRRAVRLGRACTSPQQGRPVVMPFASDKQKSPPVGWSNPCTRLCCRPPDPPPAPR
jgi:hypothetical protein